MTPWLSHRDQDPWHDAFARTERFRDDLEHHTRAALAEATPAPTGREAHAIRQVAAQPHHRWN